MLTLLLRVSANGDLWMGAALATVSIAAFDAFGALDRLPRASRAAAFAFLLAGTLGALGAPPLPLPIALPLTAAFGTHAFFGLRHPRARVRRASALLFGVAVVLALMAEAPYAIGPAPPAGPPPHTLVVLADSLGAGGYGESRTWPRILAEDDGIDVRDLSRDGQTVVKALAALEADLEGSLPRPATGTERRGSRGVEDRGARSASRASRDLEPRTRGSRAGSRHPAAERPDPDLSGFSGGTGGTKEIGISGAAWVLIALGGNDVLGEATLASYTRSLDRLLFLCRGDPHRPRTVVMLEIPSVPGRWGFAAAQRRLAARHGIVLVPKRVLANVVFAYGSTSGDVLHLTQQGHDRFAAAIRPWLMLPRSLPGPKHASRERARGEPALQAQDVRQTARSVLLPAPAGGLGQPVYRRGACRPGRA